MLHNDKKEILALLEDWSGLKEFDSTRIDSSMGEIAFYEEDEKKQMLACGHDDIGKYILTGVNVNNNNKHDFVLSKIYVEEYESGTRLKFMGQGEFSDDYSKFTGVFFINTEEVKSKSYTLTELKEIKSTKFHQFEFCKSPVLGPSVPACCS